MTGTQINFSQWNQTNRNAIKLSCRVHSHYSNDNTNSYPIKPRGIQKQFLVNWWQLFLYCFEFIHLVLTHLSEQLTMFLSLKTNVFLSITPVKFSLDYAIIKFAIITHLTFLWSAHESFFFFYDLYLISIFFYIALILTYISLEQIKSLPQIINCLSPIWIIFIDFSYQFPLCRSISFSDWAVCEMDFLEIGKFLFQGDCRVVWFRNLAVLSLNKAIYTDNYK